MLAAKRTLLCFCGGFLYTLTKHFTFSQNGELPERTFAFRERTSEEADLAGVRQIAKGTGIFQHLHVGFGNFGTGK